MYELTEEQIKRMKQANKIIQSGVLAQDIQRYTRLLNRLVKPHSRMGKSYNLNDIPSKRRSRQTRTRIMRNDRLIQFGFMRMYLFL